VKAAEEAGDNEEVLRLRAELKELATRDATLQRYIDIMTKAVLRVHNKPRDPLMLPPNGTTPTDFLRFLELVLPVRMWPDHPMNNVGINAVRRILHPDKQKESTNPLGSGIIEEATMLEWYKVYEQSVQQTKEWWKNASQVERYEFMEYWKQEKELIMSCLQPLGSPLLWFSIQEQARDICKDVPIQL
jgi:hypothetical protein